MSNTWEVWSRLIIDNRHIVQYERCVAICATKQQAIDELSRIAGNQAEDPTLPDYERWALFVKRGSLLLGFEAIP